MDVDLQGVVELELELLTPVCRADHRRVEALLADDFVEHGVSGRRWDRDAIVDALEHDPGSACEPIDMHAALLAPGVVLVTYRVAGPRPSLRASIWTVDGDRWRVRFHQGTPVDAG